jgi:hypothetical protein
MTGDSKIIDIQLLLKWLRTMAAEMELHRGDLYYEGAAKAYHVTFELLESGAFYIK